MKPAALTAADLAYCKERLKNHWPWTPHTYGLIASLVAMAEERNEMLAAKQQPAPQPSIHGL